MCGRFNQTASGEEIAEAFSLDATPSLAPRFNIAPTQPVAVVLLEPGSGRRVLAERKWGLVPKDALGKERGFINARAESAAAKPAFAEAFTMRRCLVPATGFYEWRPLGSRRQPWLFRLVSGAPFAFAGLWEPAPPKVPDALPTCTILTTQPNELTRPVHDRMPVILEREGYARWLDPALRAPHELRALLRPYSAAGMTAYPVSDRVNSAANDDAACLAPA